MTLPIVSGLYAGLLALLYLYLSMRIPPLRYKYRVGIGDGGEDELARAVRVHANFMEYVPIALVILLLTELSHGPLWVMHAVGGTLLVGRTLHAFGLTQSRGATKPRTVGMVLTFFSLAAGGLFLIINGVLALSQISA